MTSEDRRSLVRRLHGEGLSQRAIARRLKISRNTVRDDLHRIEASAEPGDGPGSEPPGEPGAPAAPQASDGAVTGAGPVGAPPGEPMAHPHEPVAPLPRRVAQPLDGVDLSRSPAARRDLAVLAQTGRTPEDLVHQALAVLAGHYGRALAAGDIERGVPFAVTGMVLHPLPHRAVTTTPPAAAAGGV